MFTERRWLEGQRLRPEWCRWPQGSFGRGPADARTSSRSGRPHRRNAATGM